MKIAILGFGTVGRGAYLIARDTASIEVSKILVRTLRPEMTELVLDSEKDNIFTKDINDVINDTSIDLVVESIGGTEVAKDYVLKCLNAKKHVVTPNKNLVSACYDELMEAAVKNGVEFRFTPSVGGGIAWLFNLKRTKRCEKIQEIRGIVNGTCNYILDAMHRKGVDYAEILKSAQELGYAEADPSADVDGIDTLRKTVISTNIAFDTTILEEDVPCFGISNIKASDIKWFNENGFVCKLMMNSKLDGDKISAYVEPVLFGNGSLEANVNENYNLITLVGEKIGTQSFYGQGAGMFPTGESVIQDVADINDGVNLVNKTDNRKLSVDNSKVVHDYYLRCDGKIEIKKDVSVAEMHKFAEECIKKGQEIFFVALPVDK